MQLDRRHLLIGCALVAAAIAWWELGHPGYQTAEQRRARAEAAEAARPRLYRWRNAEGVTHITSERPPAGVAFEEIEPREDVNIVPMDGPAPEPPN
jgi:hypothetical protein